MATHRSTSQHTDSGSKGPRRRNGKGKSRGKMNDQFPEGKGTGGGTGGENKPSPFTPLAKELPQWPSLENTTTNFASAPSSSSALQSQRDQEAVLLLKQAYPDPSKMPPESKEFIERVEKENAKAVTKNLHWTTRAMGRAQKTLADTLEAKKEIINKSRADIETYRSTIQSLTDKVSPAALAAMPPMANLNTEVEDLTTDAEHEEEKLQAQLQRVLRTCVGSLGVNLTVHRERIDIQELPEEEAPEAGSNKRPRSLEPFGVAPSKEIKELKESKQPREPDASM
eukprot:s1089_g7.t1